MRIFGLTVGRNEADRYLVPMLQHAMEYLDDLFFYDDHSDDGTGDIAFELNASVEWRHPDNPSFAMDEGSFRGNAWRSFEEWCQPTPGDWILVIDCDEMLVSWSSARPDDVRHSLESTIQAAGQNVGVNLRIPEVWGFDDDGCPLIRVDGMWDTIHAPRLFAYRPNGTFAAGRLGVPAVPSYVMGGMTWYSTESLFLMHFGYADERDQQRKYERYAGQPGHSSAHVESIRLPRDMQTLQRWNGPYWAGMRSEWSLSTSS